MSESLFVSKSIFYEENGKGLPVPDDEFVQIWEQVNSESYYPRKEADKIEEFNHGLEEIVNFWNESVDLIDLLEEFLHFHYNPPEVVEHPPKFVLLVCATFLSFINIQTEAGIIKADQYILTERAHGSASLFQEVLLDILSLGRERSPFPKITIQDRNFLVVVTSLSKLCACEGNRKLITSIFGHELSAICGGCISSLVDRLEQLLELWSVFEQDTTKFEEFLNFAKMVICVLFQVSQLFSHFIANEDGLSEFSSLIGLPPYSFRLTEELGLDLLFCEEHFRKQPSLIKTTNTCRYLEKSDHSRLTGEKVLVVHLPVLISSLPKLYLFSQRVGSLQPKSLKVGFMANSILVLLLMIQNETILTVRDILLTKPQFLPVSISCDCASVMNQFFLLADVYDVTLKNEIVASLILQRTLLVIHFHDASRLASLNYPALQKHTLQRFHDCLMLLFDVLLISFSEGITSILLLVENLLKTDERYLEVWIINVLWKISNGPPLENITYLYQSLWKTLIENGRKAIKYMADDVTVASFFTLSRLQHVFSDEGSYANHGISPYLEPLESILRFLSLYAFSLQDNLRDPLFFSNVAYHLIQTDIFKAFNSAINGVSIVLDFLSLFTREKYFSDSFCAELLIHVVDCMDETSLMNFLSCLLNYFQSDYEKFQLVYENEIIGRFFQKLFQKIKGNLSLESVALQLLFLVLQKYRSIPLTLMCFKNVLRPTIGWNNLDNLDWIHRFLNNLISNEFRADAKVDGNGTLLLRKNLVIPRTKFNLEYLQSLFPEFSLSDSLQSTSTFFDQCPSISVPFVSKSCLHPVANEDPLSLGSFKLFFNENSKLIPSNSITISCWFRIDYELRSTENFSKFPLFSLKTFTDDVIISLELDCIRSEVLVKFLNLKSFCEEILCFALLSPLPGPNGIKLSDWMNVVLTIKRINRFAQSNQLLTMVYFNSINLQSIPLSPTTLGKTDATTATLPQERNSNFINDIEFDCFTTPQNGELCFGFSQKSWSSNITSPSFHSLNRIGKLAFGSFSIFSDALPLRSITLLYLKGPNYVGRHQTKTKLTESLVSFSTQILQLANLFVEKTGMKGIELTVEPVREHHKDNVVEIDLSSLSVPLIIVSPNFVVEEKRVITVLEQDSRAINTTSRKQLVASSHTRRCLLLNVMDLDNWSEMGELTFPGSVSKSLSMSTCITGLGSLDVLIPLILSASDEKAVSFVLALMKHVIKETVTTLGKTQDYTYSVLAFILHFLPTTHFTTSALHQLIQFGIESRANSFPSRGSPLDFLPLASSKPLSPDQDSVLLVDPLAIAHFILNHHVWNRNNFSVLSFILRQLKIMVVDNQYQLLNSMRLSSLRLIRWIIFACVNTVMVTHQLMIDDPHEEKNTPNESKSKSQDFWRYQPRTAFEMADFRDEPEPFIHDANIILRHVISCDVRSKDIELIAHVIEFTLNVKGEEEYFTDDVFHSVFRRLEQENYLELSQIHPLCTYDLNSAGVRKHWGPRNSKTADKQPPSYYHLLNPFEFYRVYLLRLLTALYDDASGKSNETARKYLEVYRESCPPEWFLIVLENSDEIVTRSQVLRLLAFFLEKDLRFARIFVELKGFQVIYSLLSPFIQPIPILLPIFSILFKIPTQLLLYPSQTKSIAMVSQLLELEECSGDLLFVTDDFWLMNYSVPLLSLFYECLTKIFRRYETSEGEKAYVFWGDKAEELMIEVLTTAINHSAPFRRLMHHELSIEMHVKALLSTVNAYSDDDSGKDSIDMGSSGLSDTTSSKELETSDLKDERSTFCKLAAPKGAGESLLKMVHYLIRDAIRELDNPRVIYLLFTSSTSFVFSSAFERAYQLLIMNIFREVVMESQSLGNHILDFITGIITYLIPLAKASYLHDVSIFELLKICVSLIETMTVKYEISQLTEQFIIRDLVRHSRYLSIILLSLVLGMQSTVTGQSFTLNHFEILTYLREKLKYFFHLFVEDTIDSLIPRSGRSRTISSSSQIEQIRDEIKRISNIFCAYMACTSYYLILRKDGSGRLEAIRILAFLSRNKKTLMEKLVGNDSPFILETKNNGVDIFKEGLSKLIPNDEGKYELFLRGRTVDNENEEERFIDFADWISNNNDKCALVFHSIEKAIFNILPYLDEESVEFREIRNSKPCAKDLFPPDNADSLKESPRRQENGRISGEKILPQLQYWKLEGIKELTRGAILWKKSSWTLKTSLLWCNAGKIARDIRSDIQQEKSNNDLGDIIWKVDLCASPEGMCKKLIQDLNSLPPVIFGKVSENEKVSANDKDNQFKINSENDPIIKENQNDLPPIPSCDQDEQTLADDDNKANCSLNETVIDLPLLNEMTSVEENQTVVEEQMENVSEFEEGELLGNISKSNLSPEKKVKDSSTYRSSKIFPAVKTPRSMMIKEIINGIINLEELKHCQVYNIERIVGLEKRKGILFVTDDFLHLLVGFTVKEKNRVFSEMEFDWIAHETRNHFRSGEDTQNSGSSRLLLEEILDEHYLNYIWAELMKSDSPYVKIPIKEIYSFFKRCHQLQYTALEIADIRGVTALLSFQCEEECEEMLTFLLGKELPASIFIKMIGLTNFQLLLGTTSNAYNGLIENFLATINEFWLYGEITNFEYLMFVNTIAGRSFLDLNQYPVFPWILSDYQSEELDLEDPAIYRDLSKPMGAIDAKRAQGYLQRYSTMYVTSHETVKGSSSRYHYYTHYSCAGYVLQYLVRLQPYTNMVFLLPDDQFDATSHFLNNIESSWESASAKNRSDVRELTPEFFYLPDFLRNIDQTDLKRITKRDDVLDQVILPRWAKNDPNLFIKIHRQAFESKYVSDHLHEWIDLIFGYKQRGKAAIDARNVFRHLTYEGEVDLHAIADPVLRSATVSKINKIGYTPRQVFQKPHQRKVIPEVLIKKFNSSIVVESTALPWHTHLSPPLTVVGAPSLIRLQCAFSGPATFEGTHYLKKPTTIIPVGDIQFRSVDRSIACPVGSVFLPSFNQTTTIVRFSTLADGLTFQTISSSNVLLTENEEEFDYHEQLHLKPITCISVNKSGEFIVTGSEDLSVRIWQLILKGKSHQLIPVCQFVGHDATVTCVDISSEFRLVVSGGADQQVIVWDYHHQCMIRMLSNHTGTVIAVSINNISGNILTLTKEQLRIYHLNGDLLGYQNFIDRMNNVSLAMGSALIAPPVGEWQDGVVAVTGHQDGHVYLWKLSMKSYTNGSSASKLPKMKADDLVPNLSTPSPASAGKVKNCPVETRSSYQQHPVYNDSCMCPPGGPYYPLSIAYTLRANTRKTEITTIRLCSTNVTNVSELIKKAYETSRNLDLFIGDKAGMISRWTVVKLDQLPQSDLVSLIRPRNNPLKNKSKT